MLCSLKRTFTVKPALSKPAEVSILWQPCSELIYLEGKGYFWRKKNALVRVSWHWRSYKQRGTSDLKELWSHLGRDCFFAQKIYSMISTCAKASRVMPWWSIRLTDMVPHAVTLIAVAALYFFPELHWSRAYRKGETEQKRQMKWTLVKALHVWNWNLWVTFSESLCQCCKYICTVGEFMKLNSESYSCFRYLFFLQLRFPQVRTAA